MKGKTVALALFGYSMTALGAAAGEYPTIGMLFNSTDRDFIRYDCTPPRGGEIECTFAQIKVWPNEQRANAAPTAEELTELMDAMTESDGFCKDVQGIESGLITGRAPSDHSRKVFEEHYSHLKGRDREDWIVLIGEYRRLCDDPSKDNLRSLMNMLQEREKNSCRLFANTYEQTFAATESGVWVHNQGPSGVCGP